MKRPARGQRPKGTDQVTSFRDKISRWHIRRVRELFSLIQREAGLSGVDAARIAEAVVEVDPVVDGMIPGYALAMDRVSHLRCAMVFEASQLTDQLATLVFPVSKAAAHWDAVYGLRAAAATFHTDTLPVASEKPLAWTDQPSRTTGELIAVEDRRHLIVAYLRSEPAIPESAIDSIAAAAVNVPDDQWEHYRAAVHEVDALCAIFASYASTVEDALRLKSFPKLHRDYAERQAARMRQAGDIDSFEAVYANLDPFVCLGHMTEAGAIGIVTRPDWEAHRSVRAA